MIGPQSLVFDHAAQVFAVNDPLFGQLVDHWLERGLRQRCEGVIGALEVDLVNSLHFPYSLPSYISVDGMRLFAADSFLLAQLLQKDIDVLCLLSPDVF
ncbi:hypothetical protein WN943_025750 [Citrus x changshan-huyou]